MMTKQLNSALCLRPLLFVSKLVVIITFIFTISTEMGYAANVDKRLLRVSIELFPAVLAADQNIKSKQSSNHILVLALVYDDDEVGANALAEQLSRVKVIKTLPVRVEVFRIDALANNFTLPLAGIFLTQQLKTPDLASIIEYGIKYHVLVFSPFESDVARGVPVGIAIRDRILPYVNSLALSKAQLKLKSFFLRISKHYGE